MRMGKAGESAGGELLGGVIDREREPF
jgi:hypothetical protein